MINEFINDICDILGIVQPEVSFDTSNFYTNTMAAQCSLDGSTIYIKDVENLTPDYFFAIAHELRHVWQIRNDPEKWLFDYKPSDVLTAEEYNNQDAEIDANAFGVIIMSDAFGIAPQFKSLSDTTKARIFQRADEISKEL